MSKSEIGKAIHDALAYGLGALRPGKRPNQEDLEKLLNSPKPASDIPYPKKDLLFRPDDLFGHKHAPIDSLFTTTRAPMTTAEQENLKLHSELMRQQAQAREAERQRQRRFSNSREEFTKHLTALLEELAPTQLLLQSPHYDKLVQLLQHVEQGPNEPSSQISDLHRMLKETLI